jgi:prepilin-type processing-associated H-X9-DG protein
VRRRNQVRQSGLTILELLVVVGLIILFTTLLVPISSKFMKRAEKAKCLSHMRTLHSCFVSHVTDKGEWPQLPSDDEGGDDESANNVWSESGFYGFWVKALEPYGAARDTWLCPSDKLFLELRESDPDEKEFFGTYVPTPFESGAATPFRWNQPWLLERGDFHGKGAHMLMPDGSVQDSQNPFHGR